MKGFLASARVGERKPWRRTQVGTCQSCRRWRSRSISAPVAASARYEVAGMTSRAGIRQRAAALRRAQVYLFTMRERVVTHKMFAICIILDGF